jgi:hypothetical protein
LLCSVSASPVKIVPPQDVHRLLMLFAGMIMCSDLGTFSSVTFCKTLDFILLYYFYYRILLLLHAYFSHFLLYVSNIIIIIIIIIIGHLLPMWSTYTFTLYCKNCKSSYYFLHDICTDHWASMACCGLASLLTFLRLLLLLLLLLLLFTYNSITVKIPLLCLFVILLFHA